MAEVIVWGIAQTTGWVAGATATALIKIGVGVAFSALSAAMAGKAANTNSGSGGVRTQTTTAGDQTPQSFILGRYMTAGNLACPDMSHGVSGDTRYLTRVLDVSDIQCDSLESLIVDGNVCLLADGSTDPLTMSDGDGTTPAIHPDYGPTTTKPRYTGFLWAKFYDGSQTTADAMLLSKYGSYPQRPWSSDMQFRGVAYLILTFLQRNSPQIWNGTIDVKAVVKGIRLYDPRKDSTAGGSGSHRYGTPSTHEWSENPVVMIYNLFRGIQMQGGNIYGGGHSAADLPYATWAAAMNACDVLISGRKTYVAGFEVKIGTPDVGGDAPLAVIKELLKACSGEIADVGGTIYIRVGGPAMPVQFITDDDILRTSPQDLDPFQAIGSSYNGVHATFPAPGELWQVKEAPPRYDTTAEAEDGERLIANLTLPAVPSGPQVQQLMKAWLKDEMRRRRLNFTLGPEGVLLKPLDVIDWTSARNGFSGKDFEITQVAIEPRTLSTTLALREKDPTDYDWVVGDEIATTAPDANAVVNAAQTVPGFGVSGVAIKDASSTDRRPAIRLTWTADLPGVTGINYQIRVQATGVVVAKGTIGDDRSPPFDITSGIIAGVAYEARGKLIYPGHSVTWTGWLAATAPDLPLDTVDLKPNAVMIDGSVFMNNQLTLSSFSTWVKLAEYKITRVAGYATLFAFSGRMSGFGNALVDIGLFRGSDLIREQFHVLGDEGRPHLVSWDTIDTNTASGATVYSIRARKFDSNGYANNIKVGPRLMTLLQKKGR